MTPITVKINVDDEIVVGVSGPHVSLAIEYGVEFMTADETDALIRALAAARVELSKEPPR